MWLQEKFQLYSWLSFYFHWIVLIHALILHYTVSYGCILYRAVSNMNALSAWMMQWRMWERAKEKKQRYQKLSKIISSRIPKHQHMLTIVFSTHNIFLVPSRQQKTNHPSWFTLGSINTTFSSTQKYHSFMDLFFHYQVRWGPCPGYFEEIQAPFLPFCRP